MNDRPPMKLKVVTAIHNLILCFGSLGMFIAGLVGSIQIYNVLLSDNQRREVWEKFSGLKIL